MVGSYDYLSFVGDFNYLLTHPLDITRPWFTLVHKDLKEHQTHSTLKETKIFISYLNFYTLKKKEKFLPIAENITKRIPIGWRNVRDFQQGFAWKWSDICTEVFNLNHCCRREYDITLAHSAVEAVGKSGRVKRRTHWTKKKRH